VTIGLIDTDALSRDRDQLFAKALTLFRQNTAWWPDQEYEKNHIASEQEDRYEADVWEQAVSGWLGERTKVTVLSVAREALFLERPKIGTADQRRITAALERLGWKRGPRSPSSRFWVKANLKR